jgi:hypothetical protein
MQPNPGTVYTPVSRGCLVAMAIPFLLFGLIMLNVGWGQLTAGAGLGTVKYAIGAVIGLGLGLGLAFGRSVENPDQVSKRAPFALYYVLGALSILLGVPVLRTALARHQAGAGEDALAYGILAAFLLVTGAWFIIGGRIKTRRDAPLVAALARNDPEPWRHVTAWSGGRVRDGGAAHLTRAVFTVALVNVLVWPIALSRGAPAGLPDLAVWLLPLLAVGFTIVTAIRISRRLRYGGMTFIMDTFPGVVGGSLAGTVWTRTDLTDAGGVTLTATLTSLRSRETPRSEGPQLHRLSAQRQALPARIYTHEGSRYLGVPVSFPIPLSAAPTTLHDPTDRVFWRLEIESDSPALAGGATLEVPVFDLRDARERALEVPAGVEFPSAPDAPAEPAPWAGVEDVEDPPAPPRSSAPPARRIFPSTATRFAVDEERGGRLTVRSESGEPIHARIGLVLAAVSLLGLLLILWNPALQEIGGIGFIAIVGIMAGVWMWLSYRHRTAELVLSSFDVTVRSWALPERQVLLEYGQLQGASVEAAIDRAAPTQPGAVSKSRRGYDVQLTARDGRSWMAGLQANDRQQAQWVAGHLNRRIAAAG